MQKLLFIFLVILLPLMGCQTVSDLEHVEFKKQKGILFDVAQEKMADIGETAFKEIGLVVERVNHSSQRIEIFGSRSAELGEYGAVYGLYLYSLSSHQTEVYLVRKERLSSSGFSRDEREDILAKLDELVSKMSGL
ncbi:MAG: hypothetical protein HYS07_10720 [Chlamydiae bacterium]|nr:hypothetical protein [Chlamydiota bacterium]MBI3276885.1 hypothetical protein [Chlamydiota bacterium]